MPDDQNQNKLSPEEEKIREMLSKQFNQKAYWTFQEGINCFLPDEFKNSFPLSILISSELFQKIKQDIRNQNLKTVNTIEEIEQIFNYDPVAEFEKIKSQRSDLRKAEMKFRNLKRYGSIDKDRKLFPTEIKDDYLKNFCSNIKIKPEILIIYIINHIDMFSSEIQIPAVLKDISMMLKIRDTKSLQPNKKARQNYTFPGEQIKLWDEVEIILISYESVEIKTKNFSRKFSYNELGMAHKQNSDKGKKVWGTLKFFAQLNGKFPNPDFTNATLGKPTKVKDRIAELNRYLKQYFKIQDSIYKDHYKVNHCWETKFRITSRLDVNLPKDEKDITNQEIDDKIRKSNIPSSKFYQE